MTDSTNLRQILKKDVPNEIEHGVYVSVMARLIAKKLGLADEEIYKISEAGLVHDIGKVKLAGYVYVENQEHLMIEDMRYVRMHASLSYDILKDTGYDDYVLQAVLHHHENYDGTGYPDNLKGEQIPIAARILRVCDVFIALNSKRPYRAAFDVDTSISLMIDEVKNFDMKIFLTFLNVVHENDIQEILNRKLI